MIHFLHYVSLSGRTFGSTFLPKALSFQDVAIGLGYDGAFSPKIKIHLKNESYFSVLNHILSFLIMSTNNPRYNPPRFLSEIEYILPEMFVSDGVLFDCGYNFQLLEFSID